VGKAENGSKMTLEKTKETIKGRVAITGFKH